MDFNIELKSGKVLNGVIHSPGEDTRAVIILVHGLGEHVRRYENWAELFKREKIGFAGVDLPGHGNSYGRRGHIKSCKVLDEMLDILVNTSKRTFPGVPVFIYGHSLGGGIVLNYLLRRNPGIKGAIISSPWLRLSFEPEKYKVVLASIMKNIFPGLIQSSGLVTEHLSRDSAVVEKYKNDPLVHGKISVSLFNIAMNAARYSLAHASELKIPVLIIQGSDDHIVSPEGSRKFARKSGSAELKIWEECYHELHNESVRDEVFNYIMTWIRKTGINGEKKAD
jgi:alpha-beta hydrolase superfamily lysophospholipase